MKQDDFDRFLSKDQEIIPSTGFVVSVMDAVRRETDVPPPIPFPWKRALPGLSAAAFAFVSVFVVGITLFIRETPTQPLPPKFPSAFALIFQSWNAAGASWIVLALVLSFASVKLSRRFVSDKARWSEIQ
jgi:hypothetical protein